MLEKELEFFIANQQKFVSEYRGKFIVIKERAIIGVYDNPLEAYLDTQTKHQLGTFLIQHCEPGPEAYTVTISSREIFA